MKLAMFALFAYSHIKIFLSPCMLQLKQNRMSRDRRTRFGKLV